MTEISNSALRIKGKETRPGALRRTGAKSRASTPLLNPFTARLRRYESGSDRDSVCEAVLMIWRIDALMHFTHLFRRQRTGRRESVAVPNRPCRRRRSRAPVVTTVC